MSDQHDLPFVAVDRDASGEPFIDYLHGVIRAARGETDEEVRRTRQRLWVFIQEWEHLRDELHEQGELRDPTVEEYAERWHFPVRSAYRQFDEFRTYFPSETAPGRIVDEIWNGIGRQAPRGQLMSEAGVRVAAR